MAFGFLASSGSITDRRDQNFGPNTTTFIVPGESFPTRYRSTAHGISAGSGKLGAIIAQVIAFKIKDKGGKPGSNHFVNHVLEIFALFMYAFHAQRRTAGQEV